MALNKPASAMSDPSLQKFCRALEWQRRLVKSVLVALFPVLYVWGLWWQCTPFLRRQQQRQHTAAGGKDIPMAAAAMQNKLDMESHNTHPMQLPQQEKPQEQQQQQQQQQPHTQQGGDAVAPSQSTCAIAISGSTPKRGSTLYKQRHKAIVTSIKVKVRSSQIQRQSAGSAQASGSSSGGEAVAAPAPAAAFQESAQLVQKAITAAMLSMAKKGQLQHVVYTACTCFPGCVHAINSLTADTDMNDAEQHELEQQATEAAVEEVLKIGDIQAAAVLAMSGDGVPYLSYSSSSSSNGPASADYWSFVVQPIALAVPDIQQYAHDMVPVHLSLPKGAVALTADAMVQTDAVAIRVIVTCSGSSQVLFDGSWTADEAFSCGGALMLQLPVALLQRCLAVVTVLLPAASSATASYSDFSRTTDGVPPAHAERRHGMNEAVLAQLPLLLLPHEAAEEVQCLFAAMAQEAGSCAAAYNQHFVPFAQDMALALAYSKALAGHEWSAEGTRVALLAYMHDLPVAMPSCLQLLQDIAMAQQQRTPVLPLLGWQAADGSSSAAAASLSSVAVAETEHAASSSNAAAVGKAGVDERSVVGDKCNIRVSSGASNVSSTSMATREWQTDYGPDACLLWAGRTLPARRLGLEAPS